MYYGHGSMARRKNKKRGGRKNFKFCITPILIGKGQVLMLYPNSRIYFNP